jgi:hypothetical protein
MKPVILYIIGSIALMLFFEVSSNFVSSGIFYDLNLFEDTMNEEYGTYDRLMAEIIKSISYLVSFIVLLWFVCIAWLVKMIYFRKMDSEEKGFIYLMLFFGFVVAPLTLFVGPILKMVI